MSRVGRIPNKSIDLIAKLLILVCVLNINGVTSMMFGLGGAISGLILVAAVVLIINSGGRAWSLIFSLLFFAIVSYLIFGWLIYNPTISVEYPGKYFRAYGGAIIILWGLVGYVATLQAGQGLEKFLAFVRNVFLISSASVWMSPFLYQYYVNLPASFEQRMGGFFGNPNEAAIVSVIAVALCIGLPFRYRMIQLSAILMSSVSVILTFSKTGMSCLAVILIWGLVRRGLWFGSFIVLFLGLSSIILLQDLEFSLQLIVDNELFGFDDQQKQRIISVVHILSGSIDENTTTGRLYLWHLAAMMGWDSFPFGNGLGSAHHIVGGIFENDSWQGAHNTFLMIWAESGVLPVMILVIAIGVSLIDAFRYKYNRELIIICIFIIIVDMMASHNAITTRYHNIIFAIVVGIIANSASRNRSNKNY